MSMNATVSAENEDYLPTRQSLLSRIKNWEDQASWADFYNTYWRLIYSFGRKAGLTHDEAQDALQETVVAVAEEIRRFKYDPAVGSFKAWLLQQTRWRVADQFRKRNRNENGRVRSDQQTRLMEGAEDPASLNVSENLWDEEWHQNLFQVAEERVKAQVEPRTFQAFQLAVRQEWPVERVANSLGISRAQVYVAKHRVSARIKKEIQRLAKRGLQSAAEALRGEA